MLVLTAYDVVPDVSGFSPVETSSAVAGFPGAAGFSAVLGVPANVVFLAVACVPAVVTNIFTHRFMDILRIKILH
jgi:hypothetical protein